MSTEYCETCDKSVDTDIYVDGEYRNIGHCFTEYVCEFCIEKEVLEYERNESALEDHGRAKMKGEL